MEEKEKHMEMKMIKKRLNGADPPGIRVRLWRNGSWKRNLCGTVIGSYEGIVGVLLDSGIYVDVPENHLKRMRRSKTIRK